MRTRPAHRPPARRRLVLAAVVAVAGSLLAAPTASAAKADTALTLTASRTLVDRDATVRLSGRATSGRERLQRVPVRIMRRDGSRWRLVTTVRTARDGRFTHTVRPTRGVRYRAELRPTSRRQGAVSPSRAVKVRPVVVGLSPRRASYGVRAAPKVVSGRLAGRLAGRVVEVQERAKRGTWRRVATTRTDRSGRFLAEYLPKTPGARELRVSVRPGAGLVGRTTKPRALTVMPSLGSMIETRARCLGASAMRTARCDNPALDGLVLPTKDPDRLAGETGGGFGAECWQWHRTRPALRCAYGPAKASFRVAFVGDSHAAGYVPALREQAPRVGWRIETYLGVGCRWSEYPAAADGTPDPCEARTRDLEQRLKAGRYDMVVYTGRRDYRTAHPPADYAVAWAEVAAHGTKPRIVGLADHGSFVGGVRCVLRARGTDASRCRVPRSTAYAGTDPIGAAVAQVAAAGHRASLLDLRPYFCPGTQCPMVIGSTIVYRDAHHLTGTYVRTLGPYLVDALRRIARS